MAIPNGVWGIDIGQCALKALRLEIIDGQVTATAFDYVEHPKILSQPDTDPDQLTREALEQFLSRNHLKGDLVAVSVPGQSGLARFVKLPPVEEKKIGDIVRFEAKQQIPFPLEEVVWDFQKVGAGQVTDGFALETEIGLFAMKRDIISRHLQHYRDVGVEVDVIQMAPLCLCNFVAYEMLGKGGPNQPAEEDDDTPRGKRKCVVALDVGADASNLVVTDGDKIIWQRPIPLGGNHLTRALSKELKLTFAKAEHLKRNAAKSPPDLKQILAALKPVLTDLVGEVQRSLGYFTNSHRDAHVAYMVGLGSAFKLPGLQKYLGEKLQIDVRKPTKYNRLSGDEVTTAPAFADNLLSYAVAYGLAVQGLNVIAKPGQECARLTTNLLPPEIRQERLIKAKKPWALTAVALMFLGAFALTAGYAWSYNAVTAKTIEEAKKSADDAVSRVNARQTEVAAKEGERKKTADAVASIVAGKDEQINWIRLLEYINKSLPDPNGENLKLRGGNPKPGGKITDKPSDSVEPNQVKYWDNPAAKEAAVDYKDRVRGGESADVPMNESIRENLCAVDIESIHTYYTSNLKQFFESAKTETRERAGEEFPGMLPYDADNPPKDNEPGWVIAIHGTTYQKDGKIFIRDTLAYNLARLCGRKLPLPTPPGATPPTPAAPEASPDKKGPDDPIIDKVSHVFLYNCWTIEEPKPGSFEKLTPNYLKPLVSSAGPAAAPGGAPPPAADPNAAPTAGNRDGWVALAGSQQATAGGANLGGPPAAYAPPAPPPGGRGGPGGERTGGRFGPPVGVAPPGLDPNQGGTTTPAAVRNKPRYDFVVMFIWREPTPSDNLVPAATP